MRLDYSFPKARKDLLAGVTVAAISLPQAMAYALIAGVDPRFGLYSAIVITLVASIFDMASVFAGLGMWIACRGFLGAGAALLLPALAVGSLVTILNRVRFARAGL